MNKVILMGRLTKDVEFRSGNTQVANFTLAVNRRFSKQGEEKQADFISIVAFGKTAEFCNNYFKKGQQVLVVGRIQNSSWEKDGTKYYRTDVVAEEVHFADSKKDGQAPAPTQSTGADFYQTSEGSDELPF